MSTVVHDTPERGVKVFQFSGFGNCSVKSKHESSAEAYIGKPRASESLDLRMPPVSVLWTSMQFADEERLEKGHTWSWKNAKKSKTRGIKKMYIV